MHILDKIRKHCAAELLQVNEIIDNVDVNTTDAAAVIINNALCAINKGKQIRPMMALMIGKMLGCCDDRYVKLAAAAELIHIATLLHDDVVDTCDLRRGSATVNSLFSNSTSILVGDFILGTAFDLLMTLNDMEIMRIMINCTTIMAMGELTQLDMHGNCEITIEEHIKIISEKTGLLFSSIAKAGGRLARYEYYNDLDDLGMNFGIAFQIADDIMDYAYSPDVTHKNTGSDFRAGSVTLPAILAITDANSEERELWMRCFTDVRLRTDENLVQIRRYLEKHDALARATKMAELYIDKAKRAILKFSHTAECNMIIELLQFSIHRKY